MEFKEPALRFEDTLIDSPDFRHQLSEKEKELGILEQHLKRTMKVTETMKKREAKNAEAVNDFSQVLREFSQLEADDPTAVKFYRKSHGFFKDIEASRNLLAEQTQTMLVDPLNDYIKTTFSEFKEGKKTYEKISADLETASNKYASASLKKPDEIKMAENVYEATESIYKFMSLDYTYQVNCVTAKRRYVIMDRFVQMMFGYMTFYRQCAETIKEMEPFMRDLMAELQVREKLFQELDKDMERRHDMVREQQNRDDLQTEHQARTKRDEVQVSTPKVMSPRSASPTNQHNYTPRMSSPVRSPRPPKSNNNEAPAGVDVESDGLPTRPEAPPPSRLYHSAPHHSSPALNMKSNLRTNSPSRQPRLTSLGGSLTNMSRHSDDKSSGNAQTVSTESIDTRGRATTVAALHKKLHEQHPAADSSDGNDAGTIASASESAVEAMTEAALLALAATREGYLFARGLKKGSKSWAKYFVFIKDGQVMFQQKGGQAVVGAKLQLCTVKSFVTGVDRQFVFELVTPSKNILLQALSLQAKDAWIATLQAHISNALDVGVSRPQNEANLSAGKSFSSMNVLPMSNTRREEIKAVLGNDTCCDCGVPDNTWASINLGILLCIECSGVHRKIGTHISKVRSMTLDRWDDSLMQMMLAIGNTNLNSVYLSGVDDTDELMREMCSDRTKREAFIRSKYIDKAFMATSEMDKDDLNQILFDASKEASDMILAVRAVANGADVNWQTDFNDDWAPLHACCHFQNVACAEFLYQNYANINTADKQGRTPLHVAADEGHEIMVEFLLSRGATVEVKDEEGKSPLDLALAKFHPTVVTHLRLHQLEKMEVMDRTRARERRDDKTREEILKTQDEDEAAQSPLMMDSP